MMSVTYNNNVMVCTVYATCAECCLVHNILKALKIVGDISRTLQYVVFTLC